MWNSRKSLYLSQGCTVILFFTIVAFAVFLPQIMEVYVQISPIYSQTSEVLPLIVLLYLCCIPALIALFLLNQLLTNIKKAEVFTYKNVGNLRKISWCCFVVAAFLAGGIYFSYVLVIGSIITAFFGLIVRVVKNVINEAVKIKEENDFTV